MRGVVVQNAERTGDALAAAVRLSANTLVTHALPDRATGEAAVAARLRYLAWMTTAQIETAAAGPDSRARFASVPGLTGVYYEDESVPEGYTAAEDQRRAYETLKRLRPGLLVLHPLRLDPIAWDPGYLDRVFRPEFTDMITPYFYPVGSTVLGSFRQEDAWEDTLTPLLAEVERRAPGKPVVAVLQGFEQVGYPVTADLLSRQAAAYRSVWPALAGAAVFEWGLSAADAPLVGMGFRPKISAGSGRLFREMRDWPAARQPCVSPAAVLSPIP
jgi:hypothetical protein